MPDKAILGHRLLRLWREYFGFEVVYEDYDMFMKVLADKGQQYLLAQMPHAVMVKNSNDSMSFVGPNNTEETVSSALDRILNQ